MRGTLLGTHDSLDYVFVGLASPLAQGVLGLCGPVKVLVALIGYLHVYTCHAACVRFFAAQWDTCRTILSLDN